VQQFFSADDYLKWRQELGSDEAKKWRIKCVCQVCSVSFGGQQSNQTFASTRYYKGLGTSTAEEGREYFSHLPHHHRTFSWASHKDDELIEMAFSKKQVEKGVLCGPPGMLWHGVC